MPCLDINIKLYLDYVFWLWEEKKRNNIVEGNKTLLIVKLKSEPENLFVIESQMI